MTDLAFNDPCLLFAVRRESQAFRREFLPNERFPGAPCPAWFCAPRALPELSVLVLETGVGAGLARTALEWALGQPSLEGVPYRPKLVLSTGFAGGLQPGLKVGDLLVATEVIDAEGARWPTTWPGELPPGEWEPPLRRGRLLSVSRLLGSPEEKRSLGERHDALAVDMEAAALAPLCVKHGIPFGCVRAISDDVDTGLSPKLVSVLAGPGPDRGVVFQTPCLLPWLTAQENVRLGVDQAFEAKGRREREETARRWLAEVGLDEARHKRASELSAGMRQRVGIARAFALSPKVLLLDEPFGMLDSLTRQELQELLQEVWSQDRNTTLMVTHDVDEALLLSDRVAMMTSGPEARLGGVVSVPFPRPRLRDAVPSHAAYGDLRERILSFLEAHDHTEAPSAGLDTSEMEKTCVG